MAVTIPGDRLEGSDLSFGRSLAPAQRMQTGDELRHVAAACGVLVGEGRQREALLHVDLDLEVGCCP
jgi:hypothetical protein